MTDNHIETIELSNRRVPTIPTIQPIRTLITAAHQMLRYSKFIGITALLLAANASILAKTQVDTIFFQWPHPHPE